MMLRFCLFFCAIAIVSGCSSPKRSAQGGYYQNDGPGSNIPANIASIPDAVPRIEPHRPANARPYVVLGKRYVPLVSDQTFRQQGTASWYGRQFHGKKTATGEPYDMYSMSAAHPTLPLPSYARVTRAGSEKSVIVRINDRGPFHSNRIIDLSYAAAAKLGLIGPGSGQVIVEAITHADIRNNTLLARKNTSSPAPAATPTPPKPQPAPTLLASSSSTPDALDVLKTGKIKTKHVDLDNEAAQVFLQYGAFSAPENAKKLARQLNDDIVGLETRQAEVFTTARLYRVHIGPYPNRTQAVNAALRIQTATGLTPSYTERKSAARDNTSL